jgi:sensor histidine kinase YesM
MCRLPYGQVSMSWIQTARLWTRQILSLVGISLLIVLAMTVIYDAGRGKWWSTFIEVMQGGFPFTFCIAGISWLVMPRVASRVGSLHALMRWPIYLATMTMTATAGTMIAGLFYYYAFAPPLWTFFDLYFEALRSSVPITLIAGSIITIIGTATSRLEATELALRTQQLEKERAEKLATEAQLASLASRVQPHFLFNTLNSISALVRQEPAQAEILIARLSALLRSALEGAQTVPLEQELKLVADYLEIQQARFGERLRYELPALPENAPQVPPFSIQTMVENSLKHVAGKRLEGVALKVRAAKTGSDFLVEVTDNGPGFTEDCMLAGHGLDNLQGRLRAVYGNRAGLEFLKETGAMTVRLRVPAV